MVGLMLNALPVVTAVRRVAERDPHQVDVLRPAHNPDQVLQSAQHRWLALVVRGQVGHLCNMNISFELSCHV